MISCCDDDLLLRDRLGERCGRRGLGARLVGLLLDLGVAQVELALRLGDGLVGGDARLLRRLARHRLGDLGDLLDAGGLGATEILDVAVVVVDLLDLQGVDLQTLDVERVADGLEHLALQRLAVGDDLGHRELADDRADRTARAPPRWRSRSGPAG